MGVSINDIQKVQIVGGGGGGGSDTQYAEDAAHTSGDTGTMALGVRRDADTSPVSTDGDYHANIYDNAGNLKVNVKAGGSANLQVGGVAVDSTHPVPVQQAAVAHYITPDSSDNTPITTATDTLIKAAPGVGFKLVVLYLQASNSSATTTDVMFRDDVAGARKYRTTLAQNAAFAHNLKPDAWRLTENKGLYLTTSAAGSVHWTAEIVTEAV